jgi:ribosomal protein S18 acetylase RimI-like enzyme
VYESSGAPHKGAPQDLAVRVRQIGPNEVRGLRAIRLRALADAPEAFGARLDDEQRRDDAWWREWFVGGAVFIAEDRTGWHGLTTTRPSAEDPSVIDVFSMWVAPELRRRSLGQQLLAAAVNWSRHAQARRVRLGVTDDNDAGYRLYRRAGFVPTGERQPLHSDPKRQVSYLELALVARQPRYPHDREC